MAKVDYAALPPPRFRVLDIVRISIDGDPELSDDMGIVHEVRFYRNGEYRYGVSGDQGGILDEAMIAATGQHATTDSFWHPPLHWREIVQIADTHPKEKWRGYFAVVESAIEDKEDRYGVSFTTWGPRSGKPKHQHRDIEHRHLIPTGDRLPPDPVPRPVITAWATEGHGMRPEHTFSVIDEIEQYL